MSGLPIASIGRLTELRKFLENINSLESHLMDAWLALLTKKVYQLRNHGLFKPIVIPLLSLLMDCHVMEIIPMFKVGVLILRKLKLKAIHIRWQTWSIKRSLQRTARDLNRLQQPRFVLSRFRPHLQWPTIDDSLKPRWRRQTTPLLRMLLDFDPGNRRPNRMTRWDQMGKHGPRWPVTSFVRLRSAESWMRRTSSPTSHRWWAKRTTQCLRRATWRTSALKMPISWMAFQPSRWGGWYAQGNLRPTLSLPGAPHWHWWTWLTDMPQLVATLENTLSRSLMGSGPSGYDQRNWTFPW